MRAVVLLIVLWTWLCPGPSGMVLPWTSRDSVSETKLHDAAVVLGKQSSEYQLGEEPQRPVSPQTLYGLGLATLASGANSFEILLDSRLLDSRLVDHRLALRVSFGPNAPRAPPAACV